MQPIVKSILKYAVMIAITVLLVMYSLKSINVTGDDSKWDFIYRAWEVSNKYFLVFSAVIAMISHVIRAKRWNMLMKPLGYSVTLWNSFLSVMVGYFVNLAIPRGGELYRCVNLKKLDGTPVDKSLGTVIAERTVDLILLVFFIGLAIIIEFRSLLGFFSGLNYEKIETIPFYQRPVLIGVVLSILALIIAFVVVFKVDNPVMVRRKRKLVETFKSIKEGFLSIFQLENKTLFIFYSWSIWILYFFMTYIILLAFPETAQLGFLATVTIFAIGGIAMAIPLPGGTGSYHLLVPAGMAALYGIANDQATAFIVIFHAWQTLIMIIFGLLSLVITQFISKPKKSDGQQP